jgi:glycolate oxidase iron-sulfur subunit
MTVEGVNQCVHCGLCLAYCPTFAELGTEMDSPRGRIFIIKALAEGRMKLGASAVAHLDLCLGCRACETVCPAGVPYGQLIEAARAEVERRRPGRPWRRAFRWLNFSVLLPNPRLLGLAAAGLRFYQASGLRRLVRATGLLRLIPEPMRSWEPLLPTLPSRRDRAPLPERISARGDRRAVVGLLAGCIQQVAFGAQNRATARVLSANGAEVVVPPGQTCCGALHAHAGEHATALGLARRTIAAFEARGVERVIVNTSGCGAHMKSYGALLAADPAWAERAVRFAAKVEDVSEFLAREPLRGPMAPVPRTVTYHDPCHVVHGQKIRREPRALLAQVPGLAVVDLPEADWCCGSAGTYNLTQPEMAGRLQARKVAHILSTGADAVVTSNPGCIIQIAQGLRKRGAAVQVLHIVEVLDQAYGAGQPGAASASPRGPEGAPGSREGGGPWRG